MFFTKPLSPLKQASIVTYRGIPHLCFPVPALLLACAFSVSTDFFCCCFAYFTHVFLHFAHAFTCFIRELFLRRRCVFAYIGLCAWVVALSSGIHLSGLSLQSFSDAWFTCALRHWYFTSILHLHTQQRFSSSVL